MLQREFVLGVSGKHLNGDRLYYSLIADIARWCATLVSKTRIFVYKICADCSGGLPNNCPANSWVLFPAFDIKGLSNNRSVQFGKKYD